MIVARRDHNSRIPGGTVQRLAGTLTETRAPDDDGVSVETTAPRFLQRIGFPAGFAPGREGALVVVIVAPLVTLIYRLRDANWKVPWSYYGDGMAGAAYAKSIIENGWYLHTSRLGRAVPGRLARLPARR